MGAVTPFDLDPAPPLPGASATALRWSIRALAATAWLSGGIFALFIVAHYFGALRAGMPELWNEILPGIHADDGRPAANIGIGLHFALGAVILLLGPIQLIGTVRRRWPRVHRWIGWTYATSSVLTGIGGLTFIALRGTVGGPIMSTAFAIYGVLMVVCGVETVRHAVARRFMVHRAWAIRLFALAIGSWLYRMDYGFWFLFAGSLGHTDQFSGWFDYFMDFWFYVPNLLVAEIAIRAPRPTVAPAVRIGAAAVLAAATAFLLLATYFFTARAWGPAILWGFGLA